MINIPARPRMAGRVGLSGAFLICLILTAFAGRLSAGEADARLESFFKTYLDEYFRLHPMEATRLGDHRFDHRLEDLSPASRKEWLEHTRRTLRELPRQVEFSRLTHAGQLDYEIFRQDLLRGIWFAENTRPFEDDPRTYGDYLNDSIYLL